MMVRRMRRILIVGILAMIAVVLFNLHLEAYDDGEGKAAAVWTSPTKGLIRIHSSTT